MANPYSKEQKQLSQESLQIALFSLMKVKKFNEISVSELSKKAGISRMAFYRNYDSKEDVLGDYFDRSILPFYQFLNQIEDKQPTMISRSYFEYIDLHSELFEVIISSGSESLLISHFTHFVSKFYLDNVSSIPFTGDYARYWNSFVSAGLYQMTIDWIKDQKKTPISLLAQVASKLAG